MDIYSRRVHLRLVKMNRAFFGAMLCGLALTTSGCGIPGLRCAKPGPVMPGEYNWNNGKEFPSTSAVPIPPQSQAPVVFNGEIAVPFTNAANSSTGEIHPASFQQPNSAAIDNAKGTELAPEQKPGSTAEDISVISAAPPDAVSDANTNTATNTNTEAANTSVPDAALALAAPTNTAQLPVASFYEDPYLVQLITETFAGNQELSRLAEEIRIAGNEAYARSGEYRPFVSLGTRLGFTKSSRFTRDGAVEDQLEVAPGKAFPDPLGDFNVGTNVSWEIDIWQRLRNAQRAAAMRYLATQEGRNFVVTRVVAEVAENYYRLLSLDSRMAILEATIGIQQQSLKVAEAKKAAGRDTELAVQRFQAEVEKNVSQRSLIQQQIVETENRINYLAGRYPQPVARLNVPFVDLNLNTLTAGVPSDLLQNRPDIREAERRVAAAGLDLKAARARFYPSVSLTAGLGLSAFNPDYLLRTPESLVYGLAGDIVGPIINKRAIKAAYSSANATQLQAIYTYQQTVLEAHIEVVNQITKIENHRRSIEVKKRQLAALETSVDVAGKLFQNARAEYVEVLLAQRELQEARVQLVETKQEQLSAIVNAYQALGGGGF